MGGTAKEYIDSFIEDINKEINWKYLKSGRRLKKQIKDIVFQIDFYSSKFNGMDLRIEIRSECRVWCRKYGKALTIDNGIAFIPFLTDEGYWWDITSEENREIVFDLLMKEIRAKALPAEAEMEKDYNNGLRYLVYHYGFSAYANSIRWMDEVLGREEARKAANEYSKSFTESELKILKRYAEGKCDLVNERNLKYMIVNHLIII